jgi:hypothetical protein
MSGVASPREWVQAAGNATRPAPVSPWPRPRCGCEPAISRRFGEFSGELEQMSTPCANYPNCSTKSSEPSKTASSRQVPPSDHQRAARRSSPEHPQALRRELAHPVCDERSPPNTSAHCHLSESRLGDAALRLSRLLMLSLNSPCIATCAQISGVSPRGDARSSGPATHKSQFRGWDSQLAGDESHHLVREL